MQNLLLRATSATTLATLPVAALLAIFSTTFLALFGPEFTAARQPMLVMIGGMVLVTAAGPVYALLMMTGLEKQAAVAAGLSTAANLALNLLLIPRLGTMGAAVALVVGQVGAAAALLLLVRRRLGITLLWWLPARWTRP
jgi:O-antigen/teichoic acid export membrane protein